jgi:citrate lyase gamma subunit
VIPNPNPNLTLTPKETHTEEIRIRSKIKSMTTGAEIRALIQQQCSLTLSPSDGARESMAASNVRSLGSESITDRKRYSLAPSDGERVRERGNFDCILTAKAPAYERRRY